MSVLALLAGAANVLSFAPFHAWWLQLLTLAWLFDTFNQYRSTRRHFVNGWLFSLGMIATSTHWMYFSMHDYGNLPAWMAALAVVLLAAFLGLYAGALLALVSYLRNKVPLSQPFVFLLLLPSAWALSEWLRGTLLTGFPWASTGYAHTAGALQGYAPIVGVYGLGLLIAMMAGMLILLIRREVHIRAASAFLLTILLGGIGLQLVQWTSPHGKPVSVSLLQGNIPQESKFSADDILSSILMYDRMIRQSPADLIALPETAIPVTPAQLPHDFLPSLHAFATQSNSTIALGIPLLDNNKDYANSVIALFPASGNDAIYRYDKQHLVPFGEFIPPGFHWFVDMMAIPLGDMARGSSQQSPFPVRDQWIMPNICYEDLFGEEIATHIHAGIRDKKPPTILLNVSNIAWFGHSIAIDQHLQISQMRALETGRPMLRSTNTGATAVILPNGRVEQLLEPYVQGAVEAKVQGYDGVTPYILIQNRLFLICCLLVFACAFYRLFRNLHARRPEIKR